MKVDFIFTWFYISGCTLLLDS